MDDAASFDAEIHHLLLASYHFDRAGGEALTLGSRKEYVEPRLLKMPVCSQSRTDF